MKVRLLPLFAVFASVCLSASAGGPTTRELPGWGTASDPDGDCRFDLSKVSLNIVVPASASPHDLSPELNSVNAPQVLQPVRGRCGLSVQVLGNDTPGTESAQPGRVAYNGAGLVIMADERNFITLFHAVYQRPGESPVSYVAYEIRVDGKMQSFSAGADHPVPMDTPINLVLERTGSKARWGYSTAGASPKMIGEIDLPQKWPEQLRAGVFAVNTAKRVFGAEFSHFVVKQ